MIATAREGRTLCDRLREAQLSSDVMAMRKRCRCVGSKIPATVTRFCGIGLSYRGLRSRVCAHCTHSCVPATTTWFYWLLLRFRGLRSCHHYVVLLVVVAFPWVAFTRMRSLHPRLCSCHHYVVLCSCHHYVVLLVVVAFPWVMFARMRSLHPRLGSLRPYRAKFLPPLRG